MNRRSLRVAALLVFAALFTPAPAWAVLVNCTLSAPAPLAAGNYSGANLDAQGSFTINCTRDNNGGDTYFLRVTLAPAPGAATMSTPFPDTLNYAIYSDAGRTVLWPSGPSGVPTSIALSGNTPAGSATVPAYLRVPAGQTGKAAGDYVGSLTATLQQLNAANGTVIRTFTPTATLTSQASVAKSCSFGTPPSYALSYTAFQATALIDAAKVVTMSCSKGTGYTLSLDQTSAVVPTVDLRYLLVFSSSGNGSVTAAAGPGGATSHPLTLTLPAGQAGSCSAPPCNGTGVRTVTVNF